MTLKSTSIYNNVVIVNKHAQTNLKTDDIKTQADTYIQKYLPSI